MIMKEYRNEFTKYLDTKLKNSSKVDGFYTYINSIHGIPTTFEVNEEECGYYIRYPGYTCANVIINKFDKIIKRVFITRRGGAFENGDEMVFEGDPKKFEKELNKLFIGKRFEIDLHQYDK